MALKFFSYWCSNYIWYYVGLFAAGAIVGAAVLRGLSKKSNHQGGIDITSSYLDSSM